MTWGKVSDDLHSHPKWSRCSPNAKALWTTALSYCNAFLTDGLVDETVHLPAVAMSTFQHKPSSIGRARKAAAELVEVGLWERCDQGWRFHDWQDCQPTRQQVKTRTARNKRRDALHKTPEGRKLKRMVRDRDRLRDGREVCSYCAVDVKWGHNRSPLGGTFDHVDPHGPDELSNLVVACNACNGTKKDRTPREAGMWLREGHPIAALVNPPGALLDPHNGVQGDTGDIRAHRADPNDRLARSNHDAGTGRIGSDRVGPGRDGSGQPGPGQVGSGAPGRVEPPLVLPPDRVSACVPSEFLPDEIPHPADREDCYR